MTPTQLEHLRLIDAHLAALLELAAKRTPGEWEAKSGGELLRNINAEIQVICTVAMRRGAGNLPFITACAGNAEAGWRSTKEIIKEALFLQSDAPQEMSSILKIILTAWPVEKLKLP